MTAYLRVSPRLTQEEIDQANRTFLAGPTNNDAPTCAGCGAVLSDPKATLCPGCEQKNVIPPDYGLTGPTDYRCPTCNGILAIDKYNLWYCTDCGKGYSNEVTVGISRPVFPAPEADAPTDEYCYSCGGPYTLTRYNGVNLCSRCLATIKSLEGGPRDADLDAIAATAKRRAEAPLAELVGELLEKWIADIEAVLRGEVPDDEDVCCCCGSGANTLTPCPYCGDLLCQDCDHFHVCDPDYAPTGGYDYD